MKRRLIQRNKAQQSRGLFIYGTATKPLMFRVCDPWPETTAHNYKNCRRKLRRYQRKLDTINLTAEVIRAFLSGEKHRP